MSATALPDRLWRRLRHESIFAFIFPSDALLFRRYDRFRQFEALALVYNIAIVFCVLRLQTDFIRHFLPSMQPESVQYKVVFYFEGLSRYIIWTAANVPLIQHFRRSFDVGLYLTSGASSLQMGLYFARSFFLASIVGSYLHHSGLPGAMSFLEWRDWLTGAAPMSARTALAFGRSAFHEIGLGVFRAAAVSYALFGGRQLARSVVRASIGYAIGAFFLFTFYHLGENAAMSALGRLYALRGHTPFRFASDDYARYALYLRYLAPYYFVCFVGGEIFLSRLRRADRRAGTHDFLVS